LRIIPRTDPSPWGGVPPGGPRPPRLPGAPSLTLALIVVAAIGVAATAFGGFYTVQPTEMAGVRRLGTVVTAEPVGPGLHFKLPWIDVVDTIQTSLDTFQLNNLTVYTVDNQAVSVGVGISYHIPAAAVMHLLYGVGRSGNIDIAESTVVVKKRRDGLAIRNVQVQAALALRLHLGDDGKTRRNSGIPEIDLDIFGRALSVLERDFGEHADPVGVRPPAMAGLEAEVAEAVVDRPALVELDRQRIVRPVTHDDIGAGVDGCAADLGHIL